MSGPPLDRQQILRGLLQLDRPIGDIVRDLSHFRWDSQQDFVTLRPHHVVEVLRRFLSGSLSGEEVESWANAVEAREDIGFEETTQQVVRAALYELANPELEGELSTEVAGLWVDRLSAGGV